VLALEIMLNQGLIRQHIEQGKIRQLKEMIEKGATDGMQTFDQHLFQLCEDHQISEEVALAEADSPANFRLMLQNKKSASRSAEVSLRPRMTPPKSTF
jgi:twitching motility protein PilU